MCRRYFEGEGAAAATEAAYLADVVASMEHAMWALLQVT